MACFLTALGSSWEHERKVACGFPVLHEPCAGLALGFCPLSTGSAEGINFGATRGGGPAVAEQLRGHIAGLRQKARALGVSDQTFDRATATLTANDRVVMLDRGAGPVSLDAPIPNFEPYRRQHVTPALIARGRTVYAANRSLLSRFEAETGVPEGIMVAIFGHETSYGSVSGSFDLIRSLATLAYEGRRRALFEPELLAAMQMMEKGVPREKLVGSYAGATGYPQFLPSVYLRDARDADGDGFADIWASQPDGLASIAGYFERAGWRKGGPWALP